MCKQGRWVGGHSGGKKITQVSVRNVSGAQFIAPRRGLDLGISNFPGPTRARGGRIRGSCGSTTSQPQLRSGC